MKKQKHHIKLGKPPGTLVFTGEKQVDKIVVNATTFSESVYTEATLDKIENILPGKETDVITWYNLVGLHDVDAIEKIGQQFDIHPLVLEDILNPNQRSKFDFFDSYGFFVSKFLHFDSEKNQLLSEQISLVMAKNFVFTFQEGANDIFTPLKQRIKNVNSRLRKRGSDYLTYAILDLIVDHHFLSLEMIKEYIENIEDAVLNKNFEDHLHQIHISKRELIAFRKSVRPLRDVVGGLIRDDFALIASETEPFLRDLYDHINEVLDTIETMREMLSGLRDVYISNLSTHMNEIMKVLTIISTLFIPLSFLAGVYGMNFKIIPELDQKYGYFAFWIVCLFLFVGMILWFKKKKWF